MHKELEKRISDYFGTEDTILYISCFDANGGVFEPLLGEEDAIISDALNHAIRVAQVINQGITLLYIVSSPTEIYMMEDKLSEVSRKTREKFGIEPLTIVRTGSIFVDIAIVAQEIDACMKGLATLNRLQC